MPAPRKRRARTAPAEAVTLPTPEEYNAFLAGVELQSVRVAYSSVESPRRYVQGTKKPEVIEGTPHYVVIPGGFVATFSAGLDCVNDGDIVTSIAGIWELEYSSKAAPMDDRLFAVFQELNLPLNAWPYVREYLQNMLIRAGWPAFVIPARRSVPANAAGPGKQG